jgi:hypothetical protein
MTKKIKQFKVELKNLTEKSLEEQICNLKPQVSVSLMQNSIDKYTLTFNLKKNNIYRSRKLLEHSLQGDGRSYRRRVGRLTQCDIFLAFYSSVYSWRRKGPQRINIWRIEAYFLFLGWGSGKIRSRADLVGRSVTTKERWSSLRNYADFFRSCRWNRLIDSLT